MSNTETTSLWAATFEVPTFPELGGNAKTDVVIVGAGIAGLSVAYMLMKAGKKVIVLDDGPIGGGETGRTTAHITNVMDDRFFVLEHIHGEDGLRKIVESNTAAIDKIESIVRAENIHCDFHRVDGFLFLGQGDREEILDEELAASRRGGITNAAKLSHIPGAAFESGPCLRFPNQAQFHVLKYLAGLTEAIVLGGGRIYCDTKVTSVTGGSLCTVETEKKHIVTAKAVCVCTNASITDMYTTHLKQAPYRTCVIAAVIPRGTVPNALYWDTPHPYHYVRVQRLEEPEPNTLRRGEQYDALIVGGEDFKTAHEDDVEARWSNLERWMRERWPVAREIIYKWSGQVFEPNDFVAFIGPNPDGAENVYMVSGDSGQGMTHGTIAGMLLTDLIVGAANPWASLYDPKRISLRAKPVEEFAKENADVALRYVKDLLRPDFGSETDIRLGEGRVLREGTHRVAVYRDEEGEIHKCSAVCTHLKCTVAWNSAEKTWDCPCHGSRFDPYGKVLTGPAVQDLGQVETKAKRRYA